MIQFVYIIVVTTLLGLDRSYKCGYTLWSVVIHGPCILTPSFLRRVEYAPHDLKK